LFKLEGLRHPKFIHKKFSNTSAVSISQPTLLIGDKAWRTQYNGYIYDLGDLWNQKFRQPFVYAVWAGRKPINAGLCRWISSTAEKNLNRLDELARVHGTKHGFSSQEAEHYIQNVLHYRIEEAELSAMDAFFELIGSIEEPAVCRE
jgi:predicted solute-binding protein